PLARALWVGGASRAVGGASAQERESERASERQNKVAFGNNNGHFSHCSGVLIRLFRITSRRHRLERNREREGGGLAKRCLADCCGGLKLTSAAAHQFM
ncbi:hypothetical protein SRHO_G00192250, partial [Serrasalmus rhombeus]